MTTKLATNENFDIVRGNQTVRVPFDATDPQTPTTVTMAKAAANPKAGHLAALDANGNPTDSGLPKDDVEALLFAQYYPDGSVKSAAEFTPGINYEFISHGTVRTVKVRPFMDTGTAGFNNSHLVGRVVIPPFVDTQWNPYINDDGTRYKVVGVRDGIVRYNANANLTAIIAPTTVTTVGDHAFRSCTSLTSVSIPASTTVGKYAFHNCTALTSVSFPMATTIEGWAFSSCTALTSVSLPAAETIGENAFDTCSALTSVSLPSATTIGYSAFTSCETLSSVSLPAATIIGDYADGGYGGYAFLYCPALTTLSLPAATTIGEGAFMLCEALSSLSLPAATTIGAYALSDCTALASVDFGDTPRSSVPTLGTDAFARVPTTCKIIVPYTQYDAWKAASGWSALQQEFVRHAEKADKPATFTVGNLAKFDAQGNLIDSGKKADDLACYALVTKTISNGSVSLDDRACNYVDGRSLVASDELALDLPAGTNGKSRDFVLALECGATPPTISYAAYATIMAEDASALAPEEGMNIYAFTEFKSNMYLVSRKLVDTVVVNTPENTDQILLAMQKRGISTTGITNFGGVETALGLSDSDTPQDAIDAVMN